MLALDFRQVQSTLVTALTENVLMAWGLAGEEFRCTADLPCAGEAPPAVEWPTKREPQEE
jgi:hypothetical protein